MTAASIFHHAWCDLPAAGLGTILAEGGCLVLAPHPDDESLGCGGLIAACVAASRPVRVVVLTDGAGSHPNSHAYPPERLRQVRQEEVRAAARHLGLEDVTFLHAPDTAAPQEGPGFEALVQRLLTCMEGVGTILAPWRHDPHCDHLAASLLAVRIAAITGARHLAYPVWGWTLPPEHDVPAVPGGGWRLDVAAFLHAKRAAIAAHRSQYGGLITDDPTGFTLPPGLLSVFDRPFETFLQP